jgi:hypothetical protein
VSAFPGIFKADVLKPLLSAPNEEIMAQKTTKGRSPFSLVEFIFSK